MSSPTPKPYRCSDPDLILAVIHPEKPFVLGGAFQIQCLYGTVELNGYVLKAAAYEEERFLPVVLPKATHIPIDIRAHYLTEQLKMDRLKWRVKEVSVAFEDVCAAFQNEEYSAVVLISSKPPVVARFLVNLFDEEFFRPADNLYENEKWRHHCYIIKNEFPVYLYTPSFQEQYDKVFYRIEDMLKGIKNVVVMVVGNKGVGKSTLIRNLINRLISLDAMPPLYLLDGDVGQSEKNPSGCISLFRILNHKPLLGAPTSHQEKCLHSSYFFGSNTPATNMGLYVNVMQHLTKEYIANCPENKNSILIVNTLGWIEDEGNNLMMNVISNIEPTLIINLKSHQRNVANFQIPLQLSERTVELIALPRANENITRQNNSADLRQWLYFGYFAHTLTAGRIYYNYLSEVRPLSVPFNKIAVFVHPELPEVQDRLILSLLNCSIVALCEIDINYMNVSCCNDGPFAGSRTGTANICKAFKEVECFPKKPGCYPKRIYLKDPHKDPPHAFLRCYGFGLVRAVDPKTRQFFVITPVDMNLLKRVKVFALGHELQTPTLLLQNQPNTIGAPYVVRMDPNAILDETVLQLYSSMKNVTGHKRANLNRRNNQQAGPSGIRRHKGYKRS